MIVRRKLVGIEGGGGNGMVRLCGRMLVCRLRGVGVAVEVRLLILVWLDALLNI